MLDALRERVLMVMFVAAVVLLCGAAAARATSFTPGDVVVERDGNGEALSSAAAPVSLEEFGPLGAFAESIALPTAVNEGGTGNKPFSDSGGATSDGGLTLSANGGCLVTVGIDAKPGTAHVLETKDTTNPRVVAVVSGSGTVNTTTALTNFANENNPRSAASSDCNKLWVGGNGTKTTGGVIAATLGATSGTQLTTSDSNVRDVEIFNNQLYTSADPTKAGNVNVATVGSGLPTSGGQTITNLPFAKIGEPEQPYAYSLLTLGLGSTPDTLYLADLRTGGETSAIVKYGLNGEGKWIQHGSVEIPCENCAAGEGVTGLTANDVNGLVTIYATTSGVGGKEGYLYRVEDDSGVNGTFSGVPEEIAKAATNEAFRGVAFAPGTTIGSGGTPPPTPTITSTVKTLSEASGDPTNQTTVPITVEDPAYPANKLTVNVTSSNETAVPASGITVTGTGKERIVHITPGGVGISKLSITVEDPNNAFATWPVKVGVSANQGSESDRYYSETSSTSASVSVGGGYMILASDENNTIGLYKERESGPPVRTWNFDSELPFGATAINIHGVARAGNTLYFVGGFDNTKGGEAQPARNTMFSVRINGSGAGTELFYIGSYLGLREDLTDWDSENGAPLGLAESAASGKAGESPEGFKIEGVDFLPGSTTEAYLTFRAPLEPKGEITQGDRTKALVIPVTNFSSLFNGNPGTTHATFGEPLEWSMPDTEAEAGEAAGLSIRSIRANGEGEYLIVASTAGSKDNVFQVWGWDGEPEDEPVLLNSEVGANVAEGVWGAVTSTPRPITNGSEAELLQDDSKTQWYGEGTKDAEQGLNLGLQKSLGRLVKLEIPAPGTPSPPKLVSGGNPNKGKFTIKWKPAPTLRARFTLQHKNAEGTWTTVATGLKERQYTFNPEQEGTWHYRVKESNETGESGYSEESAEAIKADETAPYTPTAKADREPDYSGKGGWYKDTVTVSFTANGDPTLKDGSSPSGVETSTLTPPVTFNTSGSHTACGTVADKVGNVSSQGCLTVQVDATPPSLEIACPATAHVGDTGVHAVVTASDGESGLAQDPSGTVPIPTNVAGPYTVTRTAIDNVGHETTKSCTTEIEYHTPGAPKLTAGATPNDNGDFTLDWSGDNPMTYLGLSYTLQQHNAASETWSTVASGDEALSYEFSGAGEEEGTWVYRVQGVDPTHGQTTEYSPTSSTVVVDKTPPNAPTATPSRKPDYAGGGGWYKDSVSVSFSANGDPRLSDGSPGSGVKLSSLSGPQTFNTSGPHVACGTVEDNAGNLSPQGCTVVQVDATPPSLEITCPASVPVGEPGVTATVTASDGQSGLAVDPSGQVPIDTQRTGPAVTTETAVDNVGHETTKSCTTDVVGDPPELGRCVKAPTEEVKGKVVGTGAYTKENCATLTKRHEGLYNFEPGVLKKDFSSTEATSVSLSPASGTSITCSAEGLTGEYKSPRTIADASLKLSGCADTSGKCTTGNATPGKIISETLEGALGVYKAAGNPARDKIGLELRPSGAGAFMEFSCGSTPVKVKGAVILLVTANKMLPTVTLEGSTRRGKQTPESFVQGPKEVLEESSDNGPYTQVGLSITLHAESEESLEVNAGA